MIRVCVRYRGRRGVKRRLRSGMRILEDLVGVRSRKEGDVLK